MSITLTRAEFLARLADPERLALASPTASDDAEARMASGAPMREAAVHVVDSTRTYDQRAAREAMDRIRALPIPEDAAAALALCAAALRARQAMEARDDT